MRTLLRALTEALRQLGGTGATRNAHAEVDTAARTAGDLDAQLRRVSGPASRQAA